MDEPTLIDVVAWINDAENREPMPPEQETAYGEAVDAIASILGADPVEVAETRIGGWLRLETALMIVVDIGWHAATAAIKARAAHGGDADG